MKRKQSAEANSYYDRGSSSQEVANQRRASLEALGRCPSSSLSYSPVRVAYYLYQTMLKTDDFMSKSLNIRAKCLNGNLVAWLAHMRLCLGFGLMHQRPWIAMPNV
jgi:hypothetical protein